ncbi:MAG TPA: hypothetical protein DCM38_10775 [Gammaproteobacteria bacterium]|nr:hypothetical protein [Gammaproteobacteria bacterium]
MAEIKPIQTDDYHISYDNETTTISCKGALRLSGMDEYEPIVHLFNEVADMKLPLIYFDLKELKFLNSSGINVLSKFVIRVRQKKTVDMVLQGSNKIPWQGKSLKNLQRLMPTLTLELE